MVKALLIYSSVDGHTKTICEKIAQELKGDAHIAPISDIPENIDSFEIIVIGASIRYGKYREEVYNFIEENRALLEAKKNAFFSVNVVARKADKDTPETNPYVRKFLDKVSWNPKLVDVFAGQIDYPRYGFFDKYAIKMILWITDGPTDTSKKYDFTDWTRVKSFANKLRRTLGR